nr:hypothetical protein [Tanacetum cinerariifolium]
YLSSSSSESGDDNDDGSQLFDENSKSYRKEKHSNDEDDVEMVVEIQKDERNETYYTAKCAENIGGQKKEIDNNIDARYDRKPMIIDNNESDVTYEGKYKDNVEFVRNGKHACCLKMTKSSNADG